MAQTFVRFPLPLLMTLGCLGACDDAPATSPATDASVDAGSMALGADVPAMAFTYTPEGCAHQVSAPLATTDHYRDDRTTFGAMPEPRSVHVSWPADPATVAAFVWVTDVGTRATVVQYGTNPAALDRTATGSVNTGGAVGSKVTAHEVHVCGLSPDTTYHYRVGGEGHWSAVQHFKTAPAPGRTDYDVNFVVTGDSRDDANLWRQVQERVVGGMSPPDFELFTGDAVLVGFVQSLWQAWFDGARSTMSVMPFVSVHGNHEGLALNYLMQFAQPQTGNPTQDELYFSFDYGPVHIVVLNDSPLRGDFTGDTFGTQQAWLRADLTRARANRTRVPFIIATHHKPAFASANHTTDEDTLAVRAAWPRIYEEFGVDLVLNGHEHDFEMSRELDGEGREVQAGRRGTRYVVAAGAGATLETLAGRTQQPWSAYFESVVSALHVHATMTSLELVPRRLDGTIIEPGRITLTPRPPTP